MRRLMLTLLALVLAMSSSASRANDGTTVPLCPDPSAPDCVLSNWGQTGPDDGDGALASRRGDPMASGAGRQRMAVEVLPVATGPNGTSGGPASKAPLRTVISPINLFPKETAALISAIKRARFNPDGSIATGKERIATAAAAAGRKAGTRYTLTIYIKVPQQLKPEESGLGKRVEAINEVLLPAGGTAPGKSQS